LREIHLGQGFVALVDDEDYERVSHLSWYAQVTPSTAYAVHNKRIPNQGWKKLRLHRLIMGAPDDAEVDHIDGNGLNNQRYNLRIVTRADNMKNKNIYKNNSSGYKGVTWDTSRNKWRAQVGFNGKSVTIGRFGNLEDAAQAYDDKATQLFGEFANLNFRRASSGH
jgi:hypothetical protein